MTFLATRWTGYVSYISYAMLLRRRFAMLFIWYNYLPTRSYNYLCGSPTSIKSSFLSDAHFLIVEKSMSEKSGHHRKRLKMLIFTQSQKRQNKKKRWKCCGNIFKNNKGGTTFKGETIRLFIAGLFLCRLIGQCQDFRIHIPHIYLASASRMNRPTFKGFCLVQDAGRKEAENRSTYFPNRKNNIRKCLS